MSLISEHTSRRATLHLDPDEQGQDDGTRVAEYMRWRAFANGNQYQTQPAPGERRLTVNYARALTKKVASYVFPKPVTFSIGPTHDGDNAAELALAHLVADLNLAAQDIELEIERSIIGDAAIKVTWDAVAKRPRVVSVDPATLTAAWSPDDPRTPNSITQTYQLPGWALLKYGIDAQDDRGLHTVTESWSVDEWILSVSGAGIERRQANPYGWIPYVVLPNDPHPRRFWGRSDLIDIAQIAAELNQRLTTIATILDLSGAPVAVLENVDGSDGIRVRPGAKWELPEGSRAYLLDLLASQGLRLHTDYVTELRTALHDLSETPRTAFGDSGRPLSGAALEVEVQPLVQKVNRKRLGWERFYRHRNRMLLDLLTRYTGADLGDDLTTETIWPSILPSDEESQVRSQVQLVASHIRSRRSAAAALGDNDPEGEFARVLEEVQRLAPTPDPSDDDDDATGPNNHPSSSAQDAADTAREESDDDDA